MKGTPFERTALRNLDVIIPSSRFTAVLGQTGSGKSTFVQQLNGLLKPTSGKLTVAGVLIESDTKQRELQPLRRQIGMVFQFPEHQLFDETVLDDVMYGPLNFGFDREEAERRARRWLIEMGIGEELFDRSPFDLSGGQMRRVAIAGVLALEPKLLILDEPSAGLDPQSQEAMMQFFYNWFHAEEDRGVILVTHQMDDAAAFAEDVVVMAEGRVVLRGTPEEIFREHETLKGYDLGMPRAAVIYQGLASCHNGDALEHRLPLTISGAAGMIADWLKGTETGEDGDV